MNRVILILTLVVSFVCNTTTKAVENPVPKSDVPDSVYFAEENFQPVLRFSVASDIHINDDAEQVATERLKKFFDVSYTYAQNSASYNKLDAVVFVGDVLAEGTETQMHYFNDIVNEKIKTETQKIYMYGSHEYKTDGQKFIEKYNALYGNQETGHLVINGFHFIYLSPDECDINFSVKKQKWLRTELSNAVAEDPTKPVFVFQHPHLAGTVYGSECWSVPTLNNELSKYPQVVDFSGHSHYPMSDPRSIHQGCFTSLNTGGLSHYDMSIIGYNLDGVFPTDNEGHYADTITQKDQGEFYIVEVDATGATRIIGYDLLNDREIVKYELRTPADPSSYIYTDDRYVTSEKPYFDKSAKITILKQTKDSVTFKFPVAHCKDNVQNYKIVVKKLGIPVYQEYLLSDTFYLNPPTEFTRTFSNKYCKPPYTIEITAVSSFAKESNPLSITVKKR